MAPRKKTETQDQAKRLGGLFSAGKTEGTEPKEEAPVKPKRTRQTTAKAEAPTEPQAVPEEAPAEATAEEPKKPVKGRKKATEAPVKARKEPVKDLEADMAEAPVKGKKAVMSCRVDADQLTAWREYAQGAGVSLPTLLTAAVNEYTKKHKLTEGQLEAFKLRQKMKKV